MTAPASVRLSPAEVGRLAWLCSAAHLTIDLDELQQGVPAAQRLAPRLHGTSVLLGRRQHHAETASARLDTPVIIDPPATAGLLGLLDQAAAYLEAFADRGEAGGSLPGPQRFREQAATLRAWRADLAGLAERQHGRACGERPGPAEQARGVVER
ncbi:MAG TPA: hypothetical protein VG276_06550 [Actinomycetes bacterium]|nr:hypothetical protein [Actinomycetes bacterium]